MRGLLQIAVLKATRRKGKGTRLHPGKLCKASSWRGSWRDCILRVFYDKEEGGIPELRKHAQR